MSSLAVLAGLTLRENALDMLDLIKLAAILALTIVLLMRRWDLGLVLLVDAALVAALYLYPPLALLGSLLRGLVATETLRLAGAVFLVLVLAELLRRTASMEKMVAGLQAVVPDGRVVLALIPALVGLMPMLGGAMFSAPMVNGLGTQLKLSAHRKTFVNYWFRHAMEYVFPLYSSLLMVAAVLEISPYTFIGASYPLSLAAIAGGIFWGLVGVPRDPAGGDELRGRSAWRDLASGTWPLALVILLVLALRVDMLLSLIVVIALFALLRGIGPSQWLDVLVQSFPLRTFSAILGVMAFKQVVEDAGAVQAIPAALSGLGLPPLLVAFLVPHLTGLLTGTPPAAMALGVPLVAPIMSATGVDRVAGGVWMFAGCFSGVLLSPLHLCLALTRDYFGAQWGRLYRAIAPATALVVVTALGVALWT
jgi:integral membrane protein (TIGR00529 family)